jgi:hypothetical protein
MTTVIATVVSKTTAKYRAIATVMTPVKRVCPICGGRLIQEAAVGSRSIISDLCERPHPITSIPGN